MGFGGEPGGAVGGGTMRASRPHRYSARAIGAVGAQASDSWNETSPRDAWAERRLLVVVRPLDALPAHGRRLVRHLAAPNS
jgi:hypothetical protein